MHDDIHFDLTTGAPEATIIDRREIEPLLLKACQLMIHYGKAVECEIAVIDRTGVFLDIPHNKRHRFCDLCRLCYPQTGAKPEDEEYPSGGIHLDAQSKSRRGGAYIYTCDVGFSFWTSPLYAGGRYAGSLAAGMALAVSRNEALGQFERQSNGPCEELKDIIMELPEKSHEDIQAMARLLLVCADKLSMNPWDNVPAITKTTDTNPVNGQKIKTNLRDLERTLLAALRRGDRKAALEILDAILDVIHKIGADDFDFIRLRSIELAVLLSRAAGSPEETYDRCFGRLLESQNVQELNESLQYIVDLLCVKIFSFRGIRHSSALRRAERFIWENYTRKISLNEIASASGLSAPYFSTIFKEEMGKNLSVYLNELRVEKASGLLAETSLSLNEIARACGFEDQSWFSKIFKAQTGLSPGRYREKGNKKIIEKEKS